MTLFDSNANQHLNITEITPTPVVRWITGLLVSGAISWAGWSTNELLHAKAVAEDVRVAINRLDARFTTIDQRLERIETMLMQQGLRHDAK